MSGTHSERRYEADLAVYTRLMAGDNSARMDTLRRNLRRALREEVTDRQRQMLLLYYGQGLNRAQIARQLGVDRSTVSRTMLRGQRRLRRCLRYGGAELLKQEDAE